MNFRLLRSSNNNFKLVGNLLRGMTEEILKKFEQKRAEVLKQPGFKEGELSKEKEREILKEVTGERIQKAQPLPPGQQKVVAQKVQQIRKQSKERQIQLLIELAFEKGIIQAVEVAKQLDNPYLLDEFHDALVDQLYNKLVEMGKLKSL